MSAFNYGFVTCSVTVCGEHGYSLITIGSYWS